MSERLQYTAVPDKAVTEVISAEVDPPRSPPSPRGQQRYQDAIVRNVERFRNIPWFGLGCLGVALLTPLASLALLLWIQHRRELVDTRGVWQFLQPAAILSIFVSINAAVLHFALFEGLTVAWWVRASRTDATISQLHDIWQTGTSTTLALFRWRYAPTMSFATLFVATLPLNAFLLLGSITTPPGLVTRHETIPVPIVRELRPGYSGTFQGSADRGYYIDAWATRTNWRQVMQQLKNFAGSKYASYAYLGAYDQCMDGQNQCTDVFVNSSFARYPDDSQLLATKYYFNDTQSLFTFKAEGTGFDMKCVDSTDELDFTATADVTENANALFSIQLDWDPAYRNILQLNVSWKEFGDCSGRINKTSCELTAAVVEYPVEMRLNLAGRYRGPYYSLPVNTTWRDDTTKTLLPSYADENLTSASPYGTPTRYGGIQYLLGNWLNSNITLTTFYIGGDDRSEIDFYGPLSHAFAPVIWNAQKEKKNSSCDWDMRTGLAYNTYFQDMDKDGFNRYVEMGPLDMTEGQISNPVDIVLNQIRQSMFLASIYEGAGWWSYAYAPTVDSYGSFNRIGLERDSIQRVMALLTKTVPVYKIRWAFWGASAALTYTVILFILPTFWGFWSLGRRSTMSPVDVSRVMGAKFVENEEQKRMDINHLVNRVGHKKVYGDSGNVPLGVVPGGRGP